MNANHYEMLRDQYRLLEREHKHYSSGEISKEEYLRRARPIDETIDRLEMGNFHEAIAKGDLSLNSEPGEEY